MKKETTATLHLRDVIQGMKAEEIKLAARTIGFSLPSPAKKEQMAKRLESVLTQDADAVLDGLTVYELQLVCKMLDEGRCANIPYEAADTFSLCTMKLVRDEMLDGMGDTLVLQLTRPTEMADAFRPLASKMLATKTADGIAEVEQAAAGILTVCGTMPFGSLIAELVRLFPEHSEGWLRMNMKRKYLFKGQSPREASHTPFAATPYLGDASRQLFFLRQAGEQPEQYRRIDKDKAMRMGAMPQPELTTKGAEELLQAYIDAYGEGEGRWRLHGAWIQAQHQFPSSMIESILQEVCETEEDISEELVNTIRQFLSYIPRWTMYGHSLADRAKAAGVGNDKLAERLEKDYFHKGLEIDLEKYDI